MYPASFCSYIFVSKHILKMQLPSSDEIVKFMKKPSYRPMRAREISKRLGIPKESRKVFKKVLMRLIREGTVVRVGGGRYSLSQEEVKEESTQLPQSSGRIPREGKILGKFIRTGKTGVIMPRN